MAPPSAPKKRKVRLPENEELACKILEKHHSMMAEQPSGLSEHPGQALSAAYRGVCLANLPFRTPSDLSRINPNNYKSKQVNSCKDRYELTEKGKETACSFLARSVLDDNHVGPSNHHSEEDFSDSDSDEQYERGNPLIGSENFAERGGVRKSKAGKGPTTDSLLPSREMFGELSFSAMGSAENSLLAMPPRHSDENFLDAYEVVLILDDRETLGLRNRRNVVNNIHSQFYVTVEMKRLPVGDALWIAHRRGLGTDYVLDFIVERKNVDDLVGSIRDNRYKDQKLRLKKCGLRKLIYLVEGDPNTVDAPENVKTACFTTAILEGFDVQRTTGYADTERKYGHLTCSIIDYYRTNFSAAADSSRLCLTYDEFVKRCSDLKKVTVSNVFALQLMQVPQVTEDAALAVTRLYPTVFSLAQAYSILKCGLKNLIYLVEGDPNTVDASESVKTACFTTEILEGFDVQRTTGYSDTEKKYGQVTRSIIDYYSTNFSAGADSSRLCLTYDEFVKRCSDLEKVTMSDVFALQLMQVPQATEEAVLAVTSLYPTLLSLAQAYAMLDGDRRAQEEMLMNKCNLVKAGASKAIFKFVWAEG
ncbi:hypothetical protein ACQ4PT_017124 [Festuca glaucescens]